MEKTEVVSDNHLKYGKDKGGVWQITTLNMEKTGVVVWQTTLKKKRKKGWCLTNHHPKNKKDKGGVWQTTTLNTEKDRGGIWQTTTILAMEKPGMVSDKQMP